MTHLAVVRRRRARGRRRLHLNRVSGSSGVATVQDSMNNI